MEATTEARTSKHPIHSLCGYLGSFPPSVPRSLLNQWHPRRKAILDPFCGGGTTLVEAAQDGYEAIGIDLNPLAVAIAAAKTCEVDRYDVLRRLSDLARAFSPDARVASTPPRVQQIFHEKALSQLAYLREALDPAIPEDVFIRGTILGILHGKFRKDGTTSYLSIDMPNTFSMSPNYVRGFVKKHGLTKPPVDVFGKVRNRIDWLLREGPVIGRHPVTVLQGDATQVDSVLAGIGVKAVGGVITSPPYLGVLRYGAFNWIRLWFLREEPEAVDRTLDSTDSLDRYLSFMASFLTSAGRVLRKDSFAVLVIGDVDEGGQSLNLAGRVAEELQGIIPFAVEDLSVDAFDPSSKTTRIWGEDKKGRATDRDRILVLRRT